MTVTDCSCLHNFSNLLVSPGCVHYRVLFPLENRSRSPRHIIAWLLVPNGCIANQFSVTKGPHCSFLLIDIFAQYPFTSVYYYFFITVPLSTLCHISQSPLLWLPWVWLAAWIKQWTIYWLSTLANINMDSSGCCLLPEYLDFQNACHTSQLAVLTLQKC